MFVQILFQAKLVKEVRKNHGIRRYITLPKRDK